MEKQIKIIVILLVTMFSFQKLHSQSTISGIGGNVRPGTTAILGWDGTGANAGSLEIRNYFTGPGQPINFFTNTFQVGTFLANGNFGIGAAIVTPLFQLDVDNEINVYQHIATGSYKINGNTVLHTFNSPNNIFAGEQSGQNIMSGNHNSCFGFSASSFLWNNGNSSNIYAGINSGNAGTFPTIDNTFYGYLTGNSVNTAIGNTFIGRNSGNTN